MTDEGKRDLEEKVEELREKVERMERLEEEVEKREKIIERLESGLVDVDLPESLKRRNFLKMLGVGAGGLALSSAVSAEWVSASSAHESSGGGTTGGLSDVLDQGKDASGTDIVDGGTTFWDSTNSQVPSGSINQGSGSNLDADTLNSDSASKLGRDVKMDSSGNVQFTSMGNDTTQFTQSGTKTLTVSTTERAVFEKLSANGFSGTVTFQENGGSITKKTGLTTGASTTVTSNKNYSSPTFQAKINQTVSPGAGETFTYTQTTTAGGSVDTTTKYQTTATGITKVYGKGKFFQTGPGGGTAYINVDSQEITNTTLSYETKTTQGTITGSWDSPTVTWSIKANYTVSIKTRTAKFYTSGGAATVTAQFTANRNQFTTVYQP